MQAIAPEMVLGKDVLASDGRSMGAVVDVGVHSLREVKFLVIEGALRKYQRLGVEQIDRIDPSVVVLKPATS